MPPSKNREPHWPARWTRKRGRLIYYVVPAADRERWDGKSWFRLGATEAEAWITWYARTEGGDALTTVADAIDRYTREVLPKLAASTQRQYTAALGRLRIDGKRAPFCALGNPFDADVQPELAEGRCPS